MLMHVAGFFYAQCLTADRHAISYFNHAGGIYPDLG